MKSKQTVALIACVFCLTACEETLYSNLSERDANEMWVTLLERGIDASKVASGDGYSVAVPRDQVIRALEIVSERSLPREKFDSLGSVFSGQGMIASQTEEQARLAYAIAQELSDTFSRIDGVLDARVHVVLVQHEKSSGLTTPPSAAVFLRHNESSPVTSMISEIKDIAAKAVPGLTFERVAVMTELHAEDVRTPARIRPSTAERIGLGAAGAGILALLAAAGAFAACKFFGFSLLRRQKSFDDKVSEGGPERGDTDS